MPNDSESRRIERPLSRLRDWFEPPELGRFFEGLRPFEDRIRVEEELVGEQLVIRAELPGIDPDKDIDITVEDDVLTVRAERRRQETTATESGYRSEFRYGSFQRSLALPKGANGQDIAASYRDGILEVTVPMPKDRGTAEKISVSRG